MSCLPYQYHFYSFHTSGSLRGLPVSLCQQRCNELARSSRWRRFCSPPLRSFLLSQKSVSLQSLSLFLSQKSVSLRNLSLFLSQKSVSLRSLCQLCILSAVLPRLIPSFSVSLVLGKPLLKTLSVLSSPSLELITIRLLLCPPPCSASAAPPAPRR